MSTHEALAGMLADASRAGTYRMPAVEAATMDAAAASAGLRLFSADLADCADKRELLARLAEALEFPGWFGHNWDALADCLGDMSWAPSAGYVIVLERAEHLRRASPADFNTALEIFQDAASEWARDGQPMWFFVETDDPRLREP